MSSNFDTPIPPASSGQVAPSQDVNIPPKVGVGPTAGVLFSAIDTLINALSSLNNYLRAFSNSVLANDLKRDNEYANQISGLVLKSLTPNMNSEQKKNISNENNNALLQQQVIQARLKAHQNQEQMDIQDASSTTTNSQQLTSIISSIFQISSQILQSIIGMSR